MLSVGRVNAMPGSVVVAHSIAPTGCGVSDLSSYLGGMGPPRVGRGAIAFPLIGAAASWKVSRQDSSPLGLASNKAISLLGATQNGYAVSSGPLPSGASWERRGPPWRENSLGNWAWQVQQIATAGLRDGTVFGQHHNTLENVGLRNGYAGFVHVHVVVAKGQEQFCKLWVAGSNPAVGSTLRRLRPDPKPAQALAGAF